MRRMPWATYLWPGLPRLWRSGRATGLALATGFAILLNFSLLASFVWQELLGGWQLRAGWFVVGLLWLGSAIVAAWTSERDEPTTGVASAEGLFREAMNEYLQRRWFEAERVLGQLLAAFPRDVEGRLLLATLLRASSRYDEAERELGRLELQSDAEKWQLEIEDEKQLIAAGRMTATAAASDGFEPGLGSAIATQAA